MVYQVHDRFSSFFVVAQSSKKYDGSENSYDTSEHPHQNDNTSLEKWASVYQLRTYHQQTCRHWLPLHQELSLSVQRFANKKDRC